MADPINTVQSQASAQQNFDAQVLDDLTVLQQAGGAGAEALGGAQGDINERIANEGDKDDPSLLSERVAAQQTAGDQSGSQAVVNGGGMARASETDMAAGRAGAASASSDGNAGAGNVDQGAAGRVRMAATGAGDASEGAGAANAASAQPSAAAGNAAAATTTTAQGGGMATGTETVALAGGAGGVAAPGGTMQMDLGTTSDPRNAAAPVSSDAPVSGPSPSQPPATVGESAAPVSITFDPIAGDNRISAAEAKAGVTISGTVAGANEGDTVTVDVGGTTYSAKVDDNNNFSVDLPGSVLGTDGQHSITASVSTTDAAGNTSISTSATVTYTVDTTAPAPTVTLHAVTGDNLVNAADTKGSVTVSGTVTGANEGDVVTLNVNGNPHEARVVAGNTFSVSVAGSELGGNGEHSITASVSTTDAAGNTGTGTASETYVVDATASASITIDKIAGDNKVSIGEAKHDVAVTGKVTGDFRAGDVVTLDVKDASGTPYSGVVDGDGDFSIKVSGSVLAADSDQTISASVTSVDAAGNGASATDTKSYAVSRQSFQNNGYGNGDQAAPGNSATQNNAENSMHQEGSSGDDRLAGDNDDDVLMGLDGDDQLDARGGDDAIYGGAGRDALDGGQGDDLLVGGKDDDVLRGGDGNDDLYGGAGNDRLEGGKGDDQLAGNSGADTFVLQRNGGLDRIADLELGDRIDVSDLLPKLKATDDLDDYLRVVNDGESLTLEVDANGGGDSWVDVATLDGVDAGEGHLVFDPTSETINFSDTAGAPQWEIELPPEGGG